MFLSLAFYENYVSLVNLLHKNTHKSLKNKWVKAKIVKNGTWETVFSLPLSNRENPLGPGFSSKSFRCVRCVVEQQLLNNYKRFQTSMAWVISANNARQCMDDSIVKFKFSMTTFAISFSQFPFPVENQEAAPLQHSKLSNPHDYPEKKTCAPWNASVRLTKRFLSFHRVYLSIQHSNMTLQCFSLSVHPCFHFTASYFFIHILSYFSCSMLLVNKWAERKNKLKFNRPVKY